jgi:hypothetical protein
LSSPGQQFVRGAVSFDLKDGRIVRWVEGSGVVSKIVRSLKSPKSPAVYKVKLEDEKILVET